VPRRLKRTTIENGVLAEHRDVIEDEATRESEIDDVGREPPTYERALDHHASGRAVRRDLRSIA
jgi:hypothetical protein